MTKNNTVLKAALLALAIGSLPSLTMAAGLGPIKVFSGLGQSLRAEIEVNATAQELASLTARVGSVDAFRQASIPYTSAIADLSVHVDARAERPVIRLSSARPISDPYLNVLIELDWANGNVAREYTVLLDPVDVAPPQSAPAAAVAAPVAAPVPAPASATARAATPAMAPAAVTRTDAAPAARSHVVRRGETLHRIASSNLPAGVSLDQMLIALYRANPDAFDEGNINRLRTGEILALPSAAQARELDRGEARRTVRAQAAEFQAYRRALATAAATRAPTRARAGTQESAGRVVARVDAAAPLAENADRVQVSRSRAELPAAAAARLQALEEELGARERALEDSNERLTQLEQTVRDMQRLLELRSATLAPAPDAATAAADTPPAPAAVAEADTPAPAVAAASAETIPAATADSAAPEEPPAAETAAAPEPVPAAESTPPATEASGVLRTLLDNPLLSAVLGGVAALLLLLIGFLLGRRGRAPGEPVAVHIAPATSHQEVFARTSAQSVDAGGALPAGVSQAGLSSIDTDDGVDPVAEADVYMAYGRDAQAEDILRDALKTDPARAAIYLKLLEIHAQRGEVAQFEAVARELHGRTGGAGWDWEKAAAMGRRLDPGNPLYAERAAASDTLIPGTEIPPSVIAASLAAATAAALTEAAVESPPTAERSDEVVHTLSNLDFTSSRLETPPPVTEMQLDTAVSEVEASATALEAAFDADEIDLELEADDEVDGAAAEDEIVVAGADAPLDLDLGSDTDTDTDTDTAAAPAASTVAPRDLSDEIDFDLPDLDLPNLELPELDVPDLDLPAADAEGTETEAAPRAFDLNATVVGGDIVADAVEAAETVETVDAVDAGASAEVTTAAASEQAAASGFDGGLLDFDFDFDTEASAPPTAAPKPAVRAGGVDLTDIDLNLDLTDDAPTPERTARALAASASAAASAAATAATMESTRLEPLADAARAAADALSEDGDANDEATTKLELARAYEDMGDREGALELIEEVLRDGSATQQALANEMKLRLA